MEYTLRWHFQLGITFKEYQERHQVSNLTADLELSSLVGKEVLEVKGKGRNVIYTLKVMKT